VQRRTAESGDKAFEQNFRHLRGWNDGTMSWLSEVNDGVAR
jgi:hypothetical protein